MALHEFAHVDLDERIFGAEHEFGERLRKLGLAHAGRPKEEEAADWALRILQASTCAPYGAAESRNCLLLPNDTSAQRLLHLEESCGFGLGQAHHWDAGPHGDNGGDLLFGHDRARIFARHRRNWGGNREWYVCCCHRRGGGCRRSWCWWKVQAQAPGAIELFNAALKPFALVAQ